MRIRSPKAPRRMIAAIAALTMLVTLGATAASSAPVATTPDAIVDSETVYVVADATGAPKTAVVVDWLHVVGNGTMALVDPAPGTGEIESLTDGFAPERVGDDIVANVEVNGTADYFYRVETTNGLPLTIDVAYELDGKPVSPDELAGRDGRLRISVTIKNLLERAETITFEGVGHVKESAEVTYTVPLLCIPQFEIDGTRMSDIVAPESAQLAITGSTLTYAVPMMPSPDETAVLEMDARDIKLAPLIISVFPKLPASADFSVVDQLAELRDGLGQLRQLSEGHLKVVDGMTEGMAAYDLSGVSGAAAGLTQLQGGLANSAAGAGDLAKLAGGQYAYLDGIVTSIDAGQFASLVDLVAAITTARQQAQALESGVTGLVTLLDGQVALLQQIDALNTAALADAGVVAGRYPTDVEAQSLAGRLGQNRAMLGVLLDGGDLGAGPMPGLRDTRSNLADVGTGLTAFRQGLETLEAQSAALAGVPTAFAQLKAALVTLRDGGDPDGPGPAPSMPGLGTTSAGLTALAGGLDQASGGLASASGSLGLLNRMPELMGDLDSTLRALAHGGTVQGHTLPGIDTTVKALGQTVAGLGDGVRQAREGEALMEAMKQAAEGYRSFLGRPEGAEGNLTFLFKLDGIGK